MIPSLKHSSLSFRANELMPVRDAYQAQVDLNKQTAQKQNGLVNSSFQGQLRPVQNAGQKLDVIA